MSRFRVLLFFLKSRIGPRGWRNVEKRPTLAFYSSEPMLDRPDPPPLSS